MFATTLPKLNLFALAGTATAVSVAAVGATYLNEVGPSASFIPECSLHAATGLWCPSCGGTRMAYALTQGNFAQAFSFNPLIFVLLPAVAFFLFRISVWAVAPHSRIPTGAKFFTVPVAIAIPVVVLAFTVLRNLPYEAFSWMAPA